MKTVIDSLLNQPGIFQYRVTEAKLIPFSKAVADACRANACGRYGTCWTCPPGVGEYTALEQKTKEYDIAAVFTCKYDLEDCFDFEGMMSGQRETMKILYAVAEELRCSGEKFMVLGCEGCNLCEKCSYPDAPCRFPEKAVASVEACGIDVVSLSRNLNINYNNGPNTVTYFCIVLFKE